MTVSTFGGTSPVTSPPDEHGSAGALLVLRDRQENIRYAHTEASDADVVAAAQAVGAHDFIMALKQGYDTTLAERGVNLSVGQRQLLSFARAIVSNPRILILDEATANIDTHTEILIQNALKHLLEGRTSIVIAHRLSTIRNADVIVVLEHGRVVEMGKHAELLERKVSTPACMRSTMGCVRTAQPCSKRTTCRPRLQESHPLPRGEGRSEGLCVRRETACAPV